MANLSMRVGMFGGYGGVRAPDAPTFTQPATGYGGLGAGYTPVYPTTTDVITPNDGFGVAFTVGVAAVVALCFIRYALPAK